MTELPPNSTPLYRILTEKSVPGFGKYADMTIGNILKIDKSYIVWIYYNKEKISFHKDILETLGIEPISKPGIDPEKLKKWWKNQYAEMTPEERKIATINFYKGRKKAAIARKIKTMNEVNLSKAKLQAINHGKANF